MAAEIKINANGRPALDRVLVVDPSAANARLLSDLLRNVTLCQVHHAATDGRGLVAARDLDPQIVFVELMGAGVDGVDFTRRLRRSDYLSRDVPVIVTTAEATAAGIVAARDAGVHEFLRRPFNMGDLQKRIDAVSLKKRDWVEAVAYIGPDRRRFNSAAYEGPRKRGSDKETPELQRIVQALQIVESAVAAIESDPKQVFRALRAQAENLGAIAAGNGGLKGMGGAASALGGYLAEALKAGKLSREQLERHCAALIEAAPAETRPANNRRPKQEAAA